MKPKTPQPKLKAQIRWVSHPSDRSIACVASSRAQARRWCPAGGAVTRVAVIPLDDVEVLVRKVAEAFGGDSGFYEFTPARAALTAIGVLPKQRKGRK